MQKTTNKAPSKVKLNTLMAKVGKQPTSPKPPVMPGQAGNPAADAAAQYQQLLARIEQLEAELAVLKEVVSIDYTGNVSITSPGQILLNASGVLKLCAGSALELEGGSQSAALKLKATGAVEIHSAAKFKVSAATVEEAAATVKLNSPTVQCSGVVKSDSVITNSVVASTYSPGAGNIW